MEKISRDFLWGSLEDKRVFHGPTWKKVNRPKDIGGTGVWDLRIRNKACMMRLLGDTKEKACSGRFC